jgi:hypothetical protein
MPTPDPRREPRSETAEKPSILKTHEEFINDEARPSISKTEYEKAERERRLKEEGKDQPPDR